MDSTSPTTTLQDFVRNERELAREQIGAAWQIHVEKVQEQLQQGWRDNLTAVMDERFGALEQSLAAEVDKRVAERGEEGAAHARRKLSERLNQVARRLEQAEDIQAWRAALLDGAQTFAPKAAVFSILNGFLHYEGHRSPGAEIEIAADTRIALSEAPAFLGVLDTRDTVIAVASPSEISPAIASLLGVDAGKRVCLTPLCTGRRTEPKVAAVLFAEPGDEPLDVNALELLASLAGATLECRFHAAPQQSASLLNIAPAAPGAPALSAEDAELQARAQRFARVRVAELRLYHAAAVKRGREERRLYDMLRAELDRARDDYRAQFLAHGPLADYLHQELVRTLANGDPALLGEDYPGPLV